MLPSHSCGFPPAVTGELCTRSLIQRRRERKREKEIEQEIAYDEDSSTKKNFDRFNSRLPLADFFQGDRFPVLTFTFVCRAQW